MDPLHGVKLEQIVIDLEKEFGFERLGRLIPINCFINDP
ncbi:MAG: VF530 family DNA-binding protein, partial [Fluviicola sp.]